jgi:hypothetical protein
MKKKLLYVLFILILGGLFFCLFLSATYTQVTPQPLSPRESVTQAIEKLAKADAEAGKPQRAETALISIFSKEAEAAGMTNLEIIEIYEQVYKASQIPPNPIKELFKNFFKFKNLGWVAAGIAFLLFLLRKKLEEWAASFI